MAENQTQFDSSNLLGGESVYYKYESTKNACDQLGNITKDISDKLAKIRDIIEQKDLIWKGPAADRFWEQFSATGKEYSIDEMEDIANNKMPKAIAAAINLIEQNKALDNDIMSVKFTEAQANDNVQSIDATTDAYGVNQELNNQVQAADAVHEKEATTSAQGVDQDLNNQVHANDGIQSNTATTNAQGVDTVLINDVHTNNNVSSVKSDVTASGINTDLNNRVSTSGVFNNGSSADSSEASQASSDFNDAVGAL